LRILILGGDGMLGHCLFQHLLPRHEVKVTLHREWPVYAGSGLFSPDCAFAGLDVRSTDRLMEVVADFHPEAVVNAVGVIKQREAAKERLPCIEINALLPHRLSVFCGALGARLVHLSTDCVFAGTKGNYQETDGSDAEDLYGKTKFLGEVHEKHCLTLRTSIIGRELSRKQSLLEWFLGQTGPVKGYRQVLYSGFTTLEMSRIIEKMLVHHGEASGLYQVSSEPINKFELLRLFRDKLNHPIEIIPDDTIRSDRTLDSTRFRREFAYQPPSWAEMIGELAGGGALEGVCP